MMINTRARSYFPGVWLVRPELMVPHMTVSRLDAIDVDGLAARGISGVLIDYDDTLVSSRTGEELPGSVALVRRCSEIWGERVKVFSDSAGTHRDADGRIAHAIRTRFGIETLSHHSDKPGGIDAVHAVFGEMPGDLAVIGDRLLTDIVFGNRYGFMTIWLRHEWPTGPFSRLERAMVARYMRRSA
jgi:phosphatidylglycerophosphatase GEP4